MNAIEVKNLTKKYGVHFAVKDLSFHVKKGTVFGLLGANGAGKSTIIKMINGKERKTFTIRLKTLFKIGRGEIPVGFVM